MAEDGPDRSADQRRQRDGEIEALTKQIAAVVNSAGVDGRRDLRDYAIGLLKEETEFAEAPPAPVEITDAARFNPLAIALLLGLVSLPLLLSIVFAPVGLAVLCLAGLMGLWGVLATLFGRR